MTDPNMREAKTLEDELFDTLGAPEPAAAAEARTPPPAWLPSWMFAGRELKLPWQGEDTLDWRDAAGLGAGFGTFLFFDAVVMYAPLRMTNPPSTLPQAIVLLLLAIGLGGVFVWYVKGRWRMFGIGLMVGWIFVTMMSVGLFTGLRG